jgi:hypothetical protein
MLLRLHTLLLVRQYSMACLRSLAYSPKLPCDHLRLPLRVKSNAEDRFALITQELKNWQRSFGSFIASPKRFND